ncbi:di-heme-cytochrome C peroxidase [Allosphingosinicella sp.]|uniref:di-heme-cytochrome C peroxidase n=1 Tax=Allosphingosinicella sp. TaxID=2823234 RepID=UPI002EEBC121
MPVFLAGAQQPSERLLNYSPQGWSEEERNHWYSASQGSRLMPLSWMRALERAEDRTPFLAPDNIRRFRYLTYTSPSGSNLPVGFAEDRQSDRRLDFTRLRWLPGQGDSEPWIGFTCAACHTAEVAVGERRVRVEGGPAMGDFQSFVEAVDAAVGATADDSTKWDRFAHRVLGNADDATNRVQLAAAFERYRRYRWIIAAMNRTPMRAGFARVDAFGNIFNMASFFTRAWPPTAHPPTAPVSYPFLWNVPQHDRVQWNGSVPNLKIPIGSGHLDAGAILRNTGEVIGVFGEVVTHRRSWLGILHPFRSSVNVTNLVRLETMLERLQPPSWPEDLLGPIDRSLLPEGERLYRRDCSDCHVPLARTDLTTPVIAQMSWFSPTAPAHPYGPNVPPGTDPLMACNAFYHESASGNLQGYKSGGQRLGETAHVLDLLSVTVLYAAAAEWRQLLGAAIEVYEGRDPLPVLENAPMPTVPETAGAQDPYPGLPDNYRQCVTRPWAGNGDKILGYKGRPLTGIWATAPYLHNGSVPTLYDLLLPPAQRPASFHLGTTQFDRAKVGYDTRPSAEGNGFEFRTRDGRGNVLWGNYNGGHFYGAYSEAERRALVEYLKTL